MQVSLSCSEYCNLEDMRETKRQSMKELMQRPANDLRLNSPRSLVACQHEGIDPESLTFK